MATFYWRGATAHHPNSYDYNIASNWYYTTKINTSSTEMNNLQLVQATTPPGYGDIVRIGVNDQLNLIGAGVTFPDNMDWYQGTTTTSMTGGVIGGGKTKVFSPVSISPLLYGGFSGGETSGYWANGVGVTGATVTTSTSALKSFVVAQEFFNTGYGVLSAKVNNKYPFTSVGGGIDYAKGWLKLMAPGITANIPMQNIDATGTSAMADHYDSLRLKVNTFLEFSPYRMTSPIWGSAYAAMTGHERVHVNFVKNIDSSGLPCTNVVKGDISNCPFLLNTNSSSNNTYWSAISTPSCSWFKIDGFVNNINAKHPVSPTDANLKRFNPVTGVLDDGSTKISDVYYMGWLSLGGVTASTVSNWSHQYTEVSSRATIGSVSISSLHGWATRSFSDTDFGLGNVSQLCEIYGEINNKKARKAVGYTGDALGQTGEGYLLVDLELKYASPSDRKWKYSGSNLFSEDLPTFANPTILIVGDRYDGTGASKIDQLLVDGLYSTQDGPMSMVNPTGWTQGANIHIGGSTNIGVARLDGCYVFSNAYANAGYGSLINFGSLHLNGSVLDLRSQPEYNAWSFGVTSGAAGATSVVGGIFGDDKSVILTSNDISLFNKTLRLGTNKTINREGVVAPINFNPDQFPV